MNRSRRIDPPRAVNIEDLRRLARKRVPRVVFEFIDGAAEDELTLAANRAAFEALTFRPRHAVALPTCDLRTTLLGCDISLPVLLAPVGSARVMHHEGEVGVARTAGAAGTTYILPTTSGYRLEDVKAASSGPLWYQLYLIGGREAAEAALARASRAGFSALVVTIDTPVAGMRERDFRNGLKELAGRSLLAKIPFLPQLLARPRWLVNLLLDGGAPMLPNVIVPGQGPLPLLDVGAALAQAAVTWEDFRWIRQVWHGPLVIKGVLTSEDARRAVDHGAVAVVVSNHGGRQLDGAPASLDVLPEVVKAVGSQVEVLMDGASVAVPMLSKQSALEPVRFLLDAPTRMVLPPRVPPVLHERWKYCAPTWSERCGFSVASQLRGWTALISISDRNRSFGASINRPS